MSFWDGTRWVDEAQLRAPKPRTSSVAVVVATFVMSVGLLGLILWPTIRPSDQAGLHASPASGLSSPAGTGLPGRVAAAGAASSSRPATGPGGGAGPTAPPWTSSAPPSAGPTSGPTTAPTPAPTSSTTARLLFGLGSQAEEARAAAITKAAPIHMLSNWYNGPGDLGWMTDSWHHKIYQSAYAAGFSLHLITWTPNVETTFTASTGQTCGRAYPLSDRWADDMRQLAQAFGGPGSGPPLYVTLFTEFQTYPCVENAWNANAEANAYYRALISQYEKGIAIFHQYAPNARVSLGWGGWQTGWDDPSIGGGRSMFQYFATAMRDGDFVSFQAMDGSSNVTPIRAMTSALGAYGPVMLAHHMPDADTNSLSTVYSTFRKDLQTLLTPTSVASLVRHGLFAWSFLDDKPMRASATTFSIVKTDVTTFGR